MIRTDLALEIRESFPKDNVEIKGVILEEWEDKEQQIKITTVEIKDDKGAVVEQVLTFRYRFINQVGMPWGGAQEGEAFRESILARDYSVIENHELNVDGYLEDYYPREFWEDRAAAYYMDEGYDRMSRYRMFQSGPGGVDEMIQTLRKEGRAVADPWMGAPSEFHSSNLPSLKADLLATYNEIIMGADISLFDEAVENFLNEGGQQILDEVNAWYETTK